VCYRSFRAYERLDTNSRTKFLLLLQKQNISSQFGKENKKRRALPAYYFQCLVRCLCNDYTKGLVSSPVPDFDFYIYIPGAVSFSMASYIISDSTTKYCIIKAGFQSIRYRFSRLRFYFLANWRRTKIVYLGFLLLMAGVLFVIIRKKKE